MSISSVITEGYNALTTLVITSGYGLGVAAPPTLVTLTPGAGFQGTTRHITITGTEFNGGSAVVAISGADVTIANTVVVSDTEITVDFIIGALAAVGARDVTVTTTPGASNALTFTVVASGGGGGGGSDQQQSSIGAIHYLGGLSSIDSSTG